MQDHDDTTIEVSSMGARDPYTGAANRGSGVRDSITSARQVNLIDDNNSSLYQQQDRTRIANEVAGQLNSLIDDSSRNKN